MQEERRWFNRVRQHDVYTHLNEHSFDQSGDIDRILDKRDNSLVLLEIESFVNEILSSHDLAYTIPTDGSDIIKLAIGKQYFRSLTHFLWSYDETLYYSPEVELFYRISRELGLLPLPYRLNSPSEPYDRSGKVAELVNQLVLGIREEGKTTRFQKFQYRRQDGSFRNYRSCKEYVDALFNRYAALIVIRLDLKYKQGSPQEVTVQQAQEDLRHLLDSTEQTPYQHLFSDLVGYIWKLECSFEGLLHFHFILFFDNSRLSKDDHRGELIGKLWENVITGGRGAYFNCNRADHKSKQRRLAVGRIDWFDTEKRENLRYILAYLAKSEQCLRAKATRNTRTMGHGRKPEPKMNARGRPRQDRSSDKLGTAPSRRFDAAGDSNDGAPDAEPLCGQTRRTSSVPSCRKRCAWPIGLIAASR